MKIRNSMSNEATRLTRDDWLDEAFKAVVDGEYDHLPEAAFYMVGGIEDAVAKAKKLAEDA